VPFGNYSELQTTIEDYLEQEEVTGKITDFITLCEARVNREVSVRWMHNAATPDIDAEAVPLPVDYIEAIAWQITTAGQPYTAECVSALKLLGMSKSGGPPRAYAIVGTNALWRPDPTGVAAGTYTSALEYLAKIPALSATNTTNWLLVQAPDIYLYGSLLEAMPYVIDDERLGTWVKMYERAVGSLVSADSRGKFRPGAVMRPRSGPVEHRGGVRY